MDKIASPTELQAELRSLMAYIQGHGPEGRPDREVIASKIHDLADRVAVTRYEWEGELYSPAQLATKAQFKEIVNGSRGYEYHFVMKGAPGGKATVFKVPKKVWEKAKLPDKTSSRVRDAFAAEEIKKITKGLSMSDVIDYNAWVKKEKPSNEKKLEWLRRH